MRKILVIGANPACQKTLKFGEFVAGKVNRAQEMETYSAGKGANVCRALNCWHGEFSGRLLQFAGGETGKSLEAGLTLENIDFRTVWVADDTRTCITCLDNGRMTEIIEPSHAVPEDKIREFLVVADEEIPACAGMIISGSCPDGTADDLYVGLAQLAAKHQIPLLIDTKIAVMEMLKACPTAILKINAEELKNVSGVAGMAEGIAAMRKNYPDVIYAITDEDKPACLGIPQKNIEYVQPPHLERVVSALGAGDTASAVFFCEYLSGKDIIAAFGDGLKAASANCLTPKAGEF